MHWWLCNRDRDREGGGFMGRRKRERQNKHNEHKISWAPREVHRLVRP